MQIARIGLDLAKYVFEIHGVDCHGKTVLRKTLRRNAPNMRFVPVKSGEQLAVQAVHRIRSRLVADRVRLVNQIRGLLGEHGIVVAKDIGNLRRALAGIVGDNEDRTLNPLLRDLMRDLREELAALDVRILSYDRIEGSERSIAIARSASVWAKSKESAR